MGKRKNIKFLCVNPVGYLPLMRYIIPLLSEKHTKVITTHVNGAYSFEEFGKQKNLHVFPTINHLNSHSKGVWFKKYSLVVLEILKSILSVGKTIIYTVDVQVVAIAIMLTRPFKKRIKIVYHQFEILDPEQTQGLNKELQNYVVNHAKEVDLIIFPEITRSNYFYQTSNKAHYESLLIPNTNDLHIDRPDHIPSIAGIPDDHIIFGHVGSLGPFHYVNRYIDFIRANKNPKIAFLFIGNIASSVSHYLTEMAAMDSRIKIIRELPHAELLKLYHRINIGVILYKGIDINTEYCAPNKLYEYWAHGIPVLAHRLTGLIPIWKHEFQGRIIDFENEHELAEAVDELLLHAQSYKAPLQNYFQNHLSLEHYLPELKNKVTSLYS